MPPRVAVVVVVYSCGKAMARTPRNTEHNLEMLVATLFGSSLLLLNIESQPQSDRGPLYRPESH
jgi:hypothetical protein